MYSPKPRLSRFFRGSGRLAVSAASAAVLCLGLVALSVAEPSGEPRPEGDAVMPPDPEPWPPNLPLNPYDEGTEPIGEQLEPPTEDDPTMPPDPVPSEEGLEPIDQLPPVTDPGEMPAGYVAVPEPPVEEQQVQRIAPELYGTIAADGFASVIVYFDVPDPSDPESIVLPRPEVVAAQDKLLAELSDEQVEVSNVSRFGLAPGMSFDVDLRGLEALDRKSDVLWVSPNLPTFPTLNVSTERVGVNDGLAVGLSGAGRTVAIIDTGVQSGHSFLAGSVVSEACYSTNQCPGSTAGPQIGPGTGAPCPSGAALGCDHGTHVAGIAAGLGSGLSGVARDANVIAINVFSRVNNSVTCGGPPSCIVAWTNDIIQGLERVWDLRNTFDIAAANLSLGGGGQNTGFCNNTVPAMTFVINQLRTARIATVIASGNNFFNAGVSWPACIQNAITVGAVDDNDNVAGFSNSGPQIDLMAPGVSINSSVTGGGFGNKNGTSMAAPHVTGAFAVMRQRYPTATVPFIEQELENTGISVTDLAASMTRPRLWLPFGWRWKSGSGSGWIGWWNMDQSADKYLVGDFDGDGRDDLLSIKDPWVHLHRYTGSGWQFMWGTGSGWIHWWNMHPSDKYVVADFDGDGRDELLCIKDPWAHLMKFTGSGWQFMWGTGSGWIGWWNMDNADKFVGADFDGNGKAELLSIKDPWHHVHRFTGSGWSWIAGSNSGWIGWWNIGASDRFYAGDVDNDGKEELLSMKDPWHHVHQLNGGSWQWQWGTGSGSISLWNMSWNDWNVPLDMDGDGADELMHLKSPWTHLNNYSGGWNWFWGTGSGRFALWNMSLSDRYYAGDFDGDGDDDMLSIKDPWHHVSIWKD